MALPHEVLGVPKNADAATINAAFRRAAKKYHPDLNGGNANIPRLRRLIAARNVLAKQKKRLPDAGNGSGEFTLPRKPRGRQGVLFACAFLGAVSLIVVPVLVAHWAGARPRTNEAGTISATVAEAEIPDAGSAEIKAIRDILEASSYPLFETDIEMAPEPRLQSTARRHRFMRPATPLRKAVKEAAFLMSSTFRRLASQ